MACNCGGGRRKLVVTTNGQSASVESPTVPGMPRYRVTGSSKGEREFATYNDARIFRASFGGKLGTVR